MPDSLIILLVAWLFAAPVATLWHELGHALVALRYVDGRVDVELGAESGTRVVRLGRLAITLRLGSGFIGFCRWTSRPRSRRGAVLTLIGGPVATLLLLTLVLGVVELGGGGVPVVRHVLSALFWATLLGLIGTLIPVVYPRWMGGYAGRPSDSLQIVRLLRARRIDR